MPLSLWPLVFIRLLSKSNTFRVCAAAIASSVISRHWMNPVEQFFFRLVFRFSFGFLATKHLNPNEIQKLNFSRRGKIWIVKRRNIYIRSESVRISVKRQLIPSNAKHNLFSFCVVKFANRKESQKLTCVSYSSQKLSVPSIQTKYKRTTEHRTKRKSKNKNQKKRDRGNSRSNY